MLRKIARLLMIAGLVSVATIHGFAHTQGEKTQRQKEHSKLYKNYETGKKLPELTKTVRGDIVLRRGTPFRGRSTYALNSLSEILKPMVCGADAVVIGTVSDKTSLLTENEDYVFTDYEVTVEEVLKNNQASPIQVNSVVTVTRPGGEIQFGGKKVEAIDESFKPLEVKQRYLLLLKLIPSTGAYQAVSDGGSFQLHGAKITSLSSAFHSGLLGKETPQSFAYEIRNGVICDYR
jgi:hypothetical protein